MEQNFTLNNLLHRRSVNMKYKLIDIYSNTEEDVEFGTCELCMYIGDLTTEHYVFQDESGKRTTLEGGEWDWGSYSNYAYRNVNVIDFAEYISTLDIENLELEFPSILSNYDYYKKED